MRPRAKFLVAALAVATAGSVVAQQPAAPAQQPASPSAQPAAAPPPAAPAAAPAQPAPPPPPSFAAPNLGEKGVRALAANCAICHGTDGKAPKGSNVRGLAGRSKAELLQIFASYRDGSRPATIMHQIVKGYGDPELEAMADWFSKQKAR